MVNQYPEKLVRFVHAAVGVYCEIEVLRKALEAEQNPDLSHSEVRHQLDEWLHTWKEFGMILRVGGMDDVIAAHRYQPKPQPSNLREAVINALEASRQFQEYLHRSEEYGLTHPIFPKLSTKLQPVVDALLKLSEGKETSR